MALTSSSGADLALARHCCNNAGMTVDSSTLTDFALAERLLPATLEAGRQILDVRRRGHSVERKADLSPVTEADRAAETVILEALSAIVPDTPVIAEEAVDAGQIPEVGREFFLVDPLDGTKEFVKGGKDFTVNIGLIRDHVPVLGIVYAPATANLSVGVAGHGAWKAIVDNDKVGQRTAIEVRQAPTGPILVVASLSHRTPETDAYIGKFDVESIVSAGSSLKFCLVAAGAADLYPRMGTTMQWDTAAGDAIVRAAGGKVVTLDGKSLPYGPSKEAGAAAYRNPWFVVTGGLDPIR